MLRMGIADDVLAVPIENVREILQVARLTPLPRTPDFIRGVMNLRGAVVPVIDLAARVGHAPTEVGRRSCIVVVEHTPPELDDAEEPPDALVVGLLVDAVYEVFDCHAGDIESVPALGTRIAAEYLQGMTRARGAVIGVLALEHLLAPADLARAIAAFAPH
jgi:purine-binding chemotaxis protein CheW